MALYRKAYRGWNVRIGSARKKSGSPRTREPEVFQRASRGTFFQVKPQLRNPFVEDTFLRSYLSRVLPKEASAEVFTDLERFGDRICSEVDGLGREAELTPPRLRTYDSWGNRVDHLIISPAWYHLHDISAQEGLVAIGYERKHQQWSRLHQYAKLLLFSPSSGLYSCPLAMTDGAAKLIESTKSLPQRCQQALPRLTSRDPAQFWTSGQWMTERKGGSDVAEGTDTVAVRQHDGTFRLHGYKWFTSATDADMAFTLARVVDEGGTVQEGTQGLSLFYLEVKDEQGQYNNLEIQCLKNKLGTRQLPTSELLLDGTVAHMVGEEGRGVVGISPMLTVTRLHNSISATGAMRRIVHLARDYATKRRAFGRFLADHTLHMRTLAHMEEEVRAAMLTTLDICRLLGSMEEGVATPGELLLLRLLTPVAKLFTAKQAVAVVSEGLECFGGQGYIEDTGLPTLFRDAQVLPIWEGTTNILSLDVLRVLSKAGDEAFGSFAEAVHSRLSGRSPTLEEESERLKAQLMTVGEFCRQALQEDYTRLELAARDFALSIAHINAGSLLIEHASSQSATHGDQVVAKRWCKRPLPLGEISGYSRAESSADLMMVMEGHRLTQNIL